MPISCDTHVKLYHAAYAHKFKFGQITIDEEREVAKSLLM